jgi:pimeloyl-ACP methyl ester carboxylesterase
VATISAIPEFLDVFSAHSNSSVEALLSLGANLDHVGADVALRCPTLTMSISQGQSVRGAAFAISQADQFLKRVATEFRQADLRAYVVALMPKGSNRYVIPGRTYLRVDARGDGRIVEVLGDLSTADHVVFLIPGMSNQADNYESQLRPKAVSLYDAMRAEVTPGEHVAVIAWLGYNTPDGDVKGTLDAASSDSAKRGADQLRKDINDLRAHGLKAHITVVGHSYGSVVAGVAMQTSGQTSGQTNGQTNGQARSDFAVDDVVVVGSPGMNADTRAGLKSPNVRVWAGRTGAIKLPGGFTTTGGNLPIGPLAPLIPIVRGADPVPYAPTHGPDPTTKRFGASLLPVDGRGHSGYFRPGSKSVRSIAKVAVGKAP